MNVGDKVRMLRGKEEGIVTRIIDQKLIEIEIEDGFQIPVLKSEVVPVAREEASYFSRAAAEAPAQPSPAAAAKKGGATQPGYFIAYKPLNDRLLSVHLINNSPDVLLYSILLEQGGMYSSLASGLLQPWQANKFAQTDLQQFEQWPAWHVRLLPHPAEAQEQLAPALQQRIHPKAGTFFKSLRQAPVLDARAYLLPLTAASKLPAEEAKTLQETLLNKQESKQLPNNGPIPATVDLHFEKLAESSTAKEETLSGSDILQLQLATFEQALDRALAAGLDEITFIHGVGNGALRKEIHRRLSAMSTIAWFKDDHKEKWGYGATRVRLK